MGTIKPAPPHPEEERRIRALHALRILDSLEEREYDDLTLLASTVCRTPVALVSLVDTDRQWFKAHHGLDVRETPRDVAFCAHAILQEGVFQVADSLEDERFRDNPLATGAPHVRFYAGVPLRDDDGLPLGTLCVIDHEPRQLDDAQQGALRALGRQVESLLRLRQRTTELEEANVHRDEFIATFNHELRTPLTAIHGALRLLSHQAAGPLPPEIAGLVSTAERNSERLLLLVNDILEVAALGAGRLVLDRRPTDLVLLAERAIELAGPLCEDRRCRFVLHSEGKELVADVDDKRVQQVMQNLLSNATRFSDEGAPVDVVLSAEGERVTLSVTNQGPGIPPELGERVFTKFFQGPRADSAAAKGTGLGLFLSRRIVTGHGGDMSFTCADGHTTFSFWVPRGA